MHRFPDRKFEKSIQQAVLMKGEAVLLQLLINNLLDNAIKYSTNNSIITIVLKQHQDQINLAVMDEGVGVPLADKDKIFDKFYRVGAEFTRSTKGTGLGLYLCKRIALFHQAKLEVIPNSPKGSIFSFTYFTD
jgi:K+-sensing histidine kinase KdpD